MKKFALVLGLLLSVLPLCLAGCGDPETENGTGSSETPWWKDTANIEIEVLSTVPQQEKVLFRCPLDSENLNDLQNTTFTLYTLRENDQFLQYPFTTIKIYYKGVEKSCYQKNLLLFSENDNGIMDSDILDYFPGKFVPNQFVPEDLYLCIWDLYETSDTNPPQTDIQGVKPGINFILKLKYNIVLKYVSDLPENQ